MNKEDLDKIYDKTMEVVTGNNTSVNDAKYENLLAIPANEGNYTTYYLGTENNGQMWYINGSGSLNTLVNKELGIRPVVSLKADTRTTGIDRKGTWNIEME